MVYDSYAALEMLALRPDAMERTCGYVASNMKRFVRRKDRVLLCFGRDDERMLGQIFSDAVIRLGGEPLMWGSDLRWKTLLRMAFSSRASVIVGPPLLILGLSKLAKATGTPLNIRHAVSAGFPCPDWMIDGIIKGLDCTAWGCFDPGPGAVVCGFSCGHSRGVHLRTDSYGIDIVDDNGENVSDGRSGRIQIRDLLMPDHAWVSLDEGRLENAPCRCGQTGPRLMEIRPHSRFPKDMEILGQTLQSWTSILDCRLSKGPCGLEMELVVFPGEELPKLPTCAKRIIRPWNPEQDIPFDLKITSLDAESH